jgi:hypothetical protein
MITDVGTATVDKLADTMDGMLSELGAVQQVAAGDDNVEILALAAYEGRRIGAVSGSVPKIEGTIATLKERGDRLGGTGMEMSKLVKDVAWCDREWRCSVLLCYGVEGGRNVLGWRLVLALLLF